MIKTSKSFVETIQKAASFCPREREKTRHTCIYPEITVSFCNSREDIDQDTIDSTMTEDRSFEVCVPKKVPTLVSAYSLNIERAPDYDWSQKRTLSMQDVSQVDIKPANHKPSGQLNVTRITHAEILSASSNSSSDDEHYAEGFENFDKGDEIPAGDESKEDEESSSRIDRIMKDQFLQAFAKYILETYKQHKPSFIIEQDPSGFYIFQSRISNSRPKVFKVNHKETQAEVALKELKASSEKEDLKARMEIEIWHLAQHINIVSLLEAYKFDNKYYLAYPLPKCSLQDLLNSKVSLDESMILIIAQQILNGLDHLDMLNIVHRCIRCDSIYIDKQGNVRIGNFSCANTVLDSRRTTIIGKPSFMAPEIVKGKPYDNKIDIWALGIVIITLAEGESPYGNNTPMNVLYKITNAPPPSLKQYSNWSKQFHKLLRECLVKEPELRKTPRELLMHKAFEGLTDRERERFNEMVNNLII
jgi:hypothetical protein